MHQAINILGKYVNINENEVSKLWICIKILLFR